MPKKKIDKRLGYWASQEQYAMQDLLKFVIEAEKYGFDSCLTSDHFHPRLCTLQETCLFRQRR
jgi:alkanesulfonate monooxygenase SsuD/methylene tetrahydromethanopterin reductase-like flavin-dependent oxidoreductase (luciferase family)